MNNDIRNINPIWKWNPYRECVTVVIPTILKAPRDIFEYSLNEYQNCEVVKEIIIIDNTENKDFEKTYIVTPKIKILKPDVNLGACVNEGMKHITTDYYLITNDDVACRGRILLGCFGIVEQDPDIGLIQCDTVMHEPLDKYLQTPMKDTSYIIPTNPRGMMTGWFQFGRTLQWEDIPNTLKYFYGDDLILDRMRLYKRKVARLVNDHISHFYASSTHNKDTRAEADLAFPREAIIYRELLKELERKVNEKNSIK